jgi:hypothetical protein
MDTDIFIEAYINIDTDTHTDRHSATRWVCAYVLLGVACRLL